jgi:NAD(P)H-hydrate epimerase
MKVFKASAIEKLYKPKADSVGEDNGSVTIIGGSSLFHGAPILALKTASRIVDMVYFASPKQSIGKIAEQMKSKLMSFIWIPWEEIDNYIEKSDAALIGPGFMRFSHESQVTNREPLTNGDIAAQTTREITKRLLLKFNTKKWVIDAGSLQTIDKKWIPRNAILTPNIKEFQILFGIDLTKIENKGDVVWEMAKKHNCVIVAKAQETIVASKDEVVLVKGGNPGLTKGGSGDVLAGLTVALLAKSEPFLAASSASYIQKAAADNLYNKVASNYNMDDLADSIPEVLGKLS